MSAEGMGLTADMLTDMKRREGRSPAPLQNVGRDFYQESRRLLSSMMDERNRATGDMRDGYGQRVRETLLTVRWIIQLRMEKLFFMATEDSFKNIKGNLANATPEERKLYARFSSIIANFKREAGL